MIVLRPSDERGYGVTDWLRSQHSFSFSDYYDPRHMGFGPLRVINEDIVAPRRGFGMHGHQDMEIITYILSGELEHRDSLGSGSVIRPGVAQRMTAGTGIRHSEMNPSPDTPVHLLQIWILPERRGLPPGYQETAYPDERFADRLGLIASQGGRDGSLTINQDADVLAGRLSEGASVEHTLAPGRGAWLQLAAGRITLNGTVMSAGDGAAITEETRLTITAAAPSEFLVFDMAM